MQSLNDEAVLTSLDLHSITVIYPALHWASPSGFRELHSCQSPLAVAGMQK